ncbi:type IV secretory system conjugative DNA transfer family protein [Candidatus Saccharibacteria bacterium]|nr:type IV secretory system conjugative DNA transfer family protein [Candidatus Saccharibacteria bacterium]
MKRDRLNNRELVWHEVFLQRPYELDTVYNVLTHIAALTSRGPVIWEVRAKNGQVHYYLGTLNWSAGRLIEAFSAHTDVQFVGVKDTEFESVNTARKLKITKPVLTLNHERTSAMVRATLSAMTGGRTDTATVMQIVLGRAHSPSTIPKNLPDPNASWLNAVLGNVHNASQEQRRAAKDKADQYCFEAVIRVGVAGEGADSRLHNMISALRTLDAAGVHIRSEKEKPEHLDQVSLPWQMPLRLSVKETACFMLLPAGEEELSGVPRVHPKLVLPPKWYREPATESSGDNSNRTFAVSMEPVARKLSISPKDALEHTVLAGPTGSGKSTAMLHLILADIEAGRSVLVLDPKTDLVTSILERIPNRRKDDVIVVDPSDPCPVGFNPLSYNSDPALTTDTILSVFQELWSSSWGVRTQDVLSGALLTLAQIKGANLLWLPQLLMDEEFRKRITTQIHDPISLTPFWMHFEAMKDSERRIEVAPVLNKLRQITYRPGLRNVLGQSNPKFSLMDLFAKRKIVLVPLNKGQIGGDSARLLGSLIVGLTWSLALARANVAPEKRHMVSIFIDELQDYLALPTSFSDALAQARGLGVAYTVAHQYRGQLPPDIKAGIDANCRNKIAFGMDADDAKDMAAQAPDLDALDFMTLPRYQIYTNFQSGGRATGWVSGKTLPAPSAIRMAADLKAESMARCGVPAKETEQLLIQMMTKAPPRDDHDITDAPIGRRKKS